MLSHHDLSTAKLKKATESLKYHLHTEIVTTIPSSYIEFILEAYKKLDKYKQKANNFIKAAELQEIQLLIDGLVVFIKNLIAYDKKLNINLEALDFVEIKKQYEDYLKEIKAIEEKVKSERGSNFIQWINWQVTRKDHDIKFYPNDLFALKKEMMVVKQSLQENEGFFKADKIAFSKSLDSHLLAIKEDIKEQRQVGSWQHPGIFKREIKVKPVSQESILESPAVKLAQDSINLLKSLSFHPDYKNKKADDFEKFTKFQDVHANPYFTNFAKSVATVVAAGIGLIFGGLIRTITGFTEGFLIGFPFYTYLGARNLSINAKDCMKETVGFKPHDSISAMLFFQPSPIAASTQNLVEKGIEMVKYHESFGERVNSKLISY